MKLLLIFITAFFSSIIQQEKPKLNGTYKIVFDKKYAQQVSQITFNDSVFKKIMPDAVMYKGIIQYQKYKVIIRKDKNENPIEIDNREILKDTITFTTKSYIDISKTLNTGKLIRIK